MSSQNLCWKEDTVFWSGDLLEYDTFTWLVDSFAEWDLSPGAGLPWSPRSSLLQRWCRGRCWRDSAAHSLTWSHSPLTHHISYYVTKNILQAMFYNSTTTLPSTHTNDCVNFYYFKFFLSWHTLNFVAQKKPLIYNNERVEEKLKYWP